MDLKFLDFEQPIAELEAKIDELRFVGDDSEINISDEIERLKAKSEALTRSIFANLSSWQVAQLARHPLRPYTLDYLEVISFVGAAAVTHGSVRVKHAGVNNLHMIEHVFERLGVTWQVEGDDLLVPAEQNLMIVPDLDGAIPEIKTNVWPAFPTDLISIAITVATQASGSVLFHDWMFSGRMYFTDKLVGMGARIILCDPYRCLIQGPNRLYGENLESPDIRAGMSICWRHLPRKGSLPFAISARSNGAIRMWTKSCVLWGRRLKG